VASHSDLLVEEFQQLLKNDKNEDLSRSYLLLSRIANGLQPLKEKFEQHVRQAGLVSVEKVAENESELDPKAYADALLTVHKKFFELVVTSFKNDAGFMAALDKACRDFVNRNAVCKTSSSRSPELLARYTDILLKKSGKSSEDTELEAALNDIVSPS